MCGCGCVCLCASEEKEDEERKTEFVGCAQRREKKKKVRTKINKIINTHATVTVHICTVTVAIVHKYTIMHKLMWVFFLLKLCKSS